MVIVVSTIITVVVDLFIGVLVGVGLSACATVWKLGERMTLRGETVLVKDTVEEEEGHLRQRSIKVVHVNGPLFFASAERFSKMFARPQEDPERVEVQFHEAGVALKDYTAIHTLNEVGKRYEKLGKSFGVRNLDLISQRIVLKADVLRIHFDIVEVGEEDEIGWTPVASRAQTPAPPHRNDDKV